MSRLRKKGSVTIDGKTSESIFIVPRGRKSSKTDFHCVKRSGLSSLAKLKQITAVDYRVLLYYLGEWDNQKQPEGIPWIPPSIIAEHCYTTENSVYVSLRALSSLGILKVSTDQYRRKVISFAVWLVY